MNINNDPQWIEVDVVGETTKRKYFGKFYVKPYLTLREQSDAEQLAGLYTRGLPDTPLKDILWAVGKLKFHIIKFEADWWKGASDGVGEGLELFEASPVHKLVTLVNAMQLPKEENSEPTST